MAGLLTAFSYYPQADILVVGCNYPCINEEELQHLLAPVHEGVPATAMYNEK